MDSSDVNLLFSLQLFTSQVEPQAGHPCVVMLINDKPLFWNCQWIWITVFHIYKALLINIVKNWAVQKS